MKSSKSVTAMIEFRRQYVAKIWETGGLRFCSDAQHDQDLRPSWNTYTSLSALVHRRSRKTHWVTRVK